MTKYFLHPWRFSGNVDGPFYATGCQIVDPDNVSGMIGNCLQCEAPEHEAPELLADLNEVNLDTYFVRQPQGESETEQACNAIRVCCVCALRYGGTDRSIIAKLENNPDYCDYVVRDNGELTITVGDDGELLPFAVRMADRIRDALGGPET